MISMGGDDQKFSSPPIMGGDAFRPPPPLMGGDEWYSPPTLKSHGGGLINIPPPLPFAPWGGNHFVPPLHGGGMDTYVPG